MAHKLIEPENQRNGGETCNQHSVFSKNELTGGEQALVSPPEEVERKGLSQLKYLLDFKRILPQNTSSKG